MGKVNRQFVFIVLRKWYEYFISNHGIQQPEHEV